MTTDRTPDASRHLILDTAVLHYVDEALWTADALLPLSCSCSPQLFSVEELTPAHGEPFLQCTICGGQWRETFEKQWPRYDGLTADSYEKVLAEERYRKHLADLFGIGPEGFEVPGSRTQPCNDEKGRP